MVNEQLIRQINVTRKQHKQFIKEKYFTPVIYDKWVLKDQYNIIDMYYNRIIGIIKNR